MPEYVSSHEGDALNDAVGVVLDTIPTSGTYIATSSNKITPVNQAEYIIDDKVWGWVHFNNGRLTIRVANDLNYDSATSTLEIR